MIGFLKSHPIVRAVLFCTPVLLGFIIIFSFAILASILTTPSSAYTNTSVTSTPSSGPNIDAAGNVDGLPISNKLLLFLEQWEGYSEFPYSGQDSWNSTIGYGHVIQPGENYTDLSKQDAQNLLIQDLKTGGYISSVSRTFAGINLAQNQFDALVSLAYNIGGGAWNNLSLTRDVKAGADSQTITADFLKIDTVRGQYSNGLYRRRQAEAAMYTQCVYNGP